MAPNASFVFLLFGAALVLLSRGPRGALAAQILAVAGLFIALLALIGYLYNAQVFVSLFSLTQVALPTIAGIWLLGVAILCARPKKGLMTTVLANSPGGFIARRLIVPAIVAPICFGWIAFAGQRLKYYDDGFTVSFIVLSSIIVICVLTTLSIRAHQCRCAGSRRAGGLAAEIGIRRQRQPRDPHADERRPRHDQPAARLAPDGRTARARRNHPAKRRRAADPGQRDSRFLKDRGRQDRA
jgi:hypothetical protein